MTTALHPSSTGTIPRHFGVVLLLAVTILPAGLARADTLVLKRGAGTSQVEGAIQEVNAGEVVYKSADGDRETEPVESVLQIKAPKEPAMLRCRAPDCETASGEEGGFFLAEKLIPALTGAPAPLRFLLATLAGAFYDRGIIRHGCA